MLRGLNLKIGRIFTEKSKFVKFLMTSTKNGSHFVKSFSAFFLFDVGECVYKWSSEYPLPPPPAQDWEAKKQPNPCKG